MNIVPEKPIEVGKQIKYYFKQTFRRHSGKEYSEVMTRGLREKDGVNDKYPWAYIRLFALLFVLFAIFLLIVRFTSNELFAPTITFIAGILFNIPFLVLLYELYPERNVSFMGVLLVLMLGGAGANIVAQILFNLFPAPDPWLKAVYSGFFEELPKMGATIIVIVILGKRSPLAGFLYGAAIGCGFSIVEDMGYIFLQSNEMSVMNLTTIIEITLVRGVSAFCTHTLWTAAIGWAFCHKERHFTNVIFYLLLILSCGMHVAWDLPLSELAIGLVYAGCAIVALTECSLILFFERKKTFLGAQNKATAEAVPKTEDTEQTPEIVEDAAAESAAVPLSREAVAPLAFDEGDEVLTKSDHLYWSHTAQLCIVLGAVLMAIVAVIYCSIPFRETYGVQTFSKPENFILFMQNGIILDAEQNRAYNGHDTENDIEFEENGELYRVIQVVEKTEATYRYEYSVNYDEVTDRNYYFPVSVTAEIENSEGLTVSYPQESVYKDGVRYATFFRINGNVTGYNFDPFGRINVITYNADFVRDLTEPRYTSLFITFGAICGISVVCAVSLLIKSRRVKKLCSTKNASSAE